jgi:hypothetical protein
MIVRNGPSCQGTGLQSDVPGGMGSRGEMRDALQRQLSNEQHTLRVRQLLTQILLT